MAIEIKGVRYFLVVDIQQEVRVTRQTLWRWRRAGKIPLGRRYRDKQVVFTAGEVKVIRDYANRLKPVKSPTSVRTA